MSSKAFTIGIDARFADTGTGLGRYTRELVTHMLTQKPNGVRVVLFVKDAHAPWLSHIPKEHVQISVLNSQHYSFSEQIFFPILIKKSGIDLLWSPHFNVPFFCPVPFVVTIHDLILHRFPNQASSLKRIAYRILFSRAVRKAKSIIAVSNFTASEITNVYSKQMAHKIHVIPQGVPQVFHPITPTEAAIALERYGISEPFFLYVGNAKEHKNLSLLFDAFEQIQDPSVSLVLVSGGKELELLMLPPRTKVLREVPDDDLARLYALATALVSPSLYEGFGLPIAEAAACGCPVIAVRGSAVSEVAPKTACLIAPKSQELVHALLHPPVRSSALGQRTQRTWEQVASDTLRILLSSL